MTRAIALARTLVTVCCLLTAAHRAVAQPPIRVSPIKMDFLAKADSFDLPPPQMLGVGPTSAGSEAAIQIRGSHAFRPT